MNLVLLLLWTIVAPLFASSGQSFIIWDCWITDEVLESYQRKIINFIHESGIDINIANWNNIKSTATTKARELIDAEILKQFSDEGYRRAKF